MRNGSTNKFFLCFRPLDIDEGSHVCPADMDFNSLSHKTLISRRRSFSSIKSLSKRFRDSKRWASFRQQNGDSSYEVVAIATAVEGETDSPISTLSPCSSSVSQYLENPVEEGRAESDQKLKTNMMLNYLLGLLVVSLWVTVLWGKLVAVVITTIWICLVQVYVEKGTLFSRLWEKRKKISQEISVLFVKPAKRIA